MQGTNGRRVRLLVAFGCSAAASLTLAGPASAGFGPIAVEDDFFGVSLADVTLGGAQFSWEWGDTITSDHNVQQDTKLFKSGQATDDPGASYGPIELPAGNYHYYCTVHGTKQGRPGDMDGEIKVAPSIGSPDDESIPITWALDTDIRVGDRWDVKYKVGNGKYKPWKKNTAALGAEFGADDKPVNFNLDKVYSVKVKTLAAPNSDKQSKYSTAVSFPEN